MRFWPVTTPSAWPSEARTTTDRERRSVIVRAIAQAGVSARHTTNPRDMASATVRRPAGRRASAATTSETEITPTAAPTSRTTSRPKWRDPRRAAASATGAEASIVSTSGVISSAAVIRRISSRPSGSPHSHSPARRSVSETTPRGRPPPRDDSGVDPVLDQQRGDARERRVGAAPDEAAVHELADGRHGRRTTAPVRS
jgi:hypothetical protein